MNAVDNVRLILVPCDFSSLAYHAMEHGAYMSKSMNSRLLILHVSSREADIPAMEKKLSFVAEECFDKFDVRPETMVRQGSQPYSVIKAVAKELNPSLVILKTGGGVHTVKILSGTSTPFLVVQGLPNDTAPKTISFPIDFLTRHDEKLRQAILFSEYYPHAVMSIITPSGKGTVKERNVANSLTLTAQVLKEQGINTKFITHDKKENSSETILELSKGADMIVIQMETTSPFRKFLFGLKEEKLIINADKIPVLCFSREADFKGISA
ncbi:MAG: universal stress protein [Bacteroidales bacterium]|jgi:nucleotide-binding universal stress UspA family protein|nr:universal stress protein [Bacteroidales bacterium]